MSYRTRNVTFEEPCFSIWHIEQEILYLKRAYWGLWLIERGILLLERAWFALWLI